MNNNKKIRALSDNSGAFCCLCRVVL